MYNDPRSPISEIFRTLRTNIQFINKNKSSQSILMTSCNAGEGKSWCSSNLAIAMAQTGKKVIIVDADMRKGRICKIFDVAHSPGLSNFLSGVNNNNLQNPEEVKSYIQHTEIENLDVISAGSIPPNPAELLVLPQMIDFIEELKQNYDIVIIDGTPCQLVTDSLIVARMVDSVILVAACKSTKKKELERTTENLKNVGGRVFGIILNKVPTSAKKYEKTYYYGSSSNRK
jgi:capsular exopolysaccharide synthesis family protein